MRSFEQNNYTIGFQDCVDDIATDGWDSSVIKACLRIADRYPDSWYSIGYKTCYNAYVENMGR